MEKLVNIYSSTLSAGYTAGAGSMSVASATGLPTLAAGDSTHLTIRDQTTKLIKLIVKVTAISGATLTITPESSDANCASGDLIDGSMLTVGSIAQLTQDLNGYGTLANRPTSPQFTGSRYVASDSIYDEARWNGSSWDQFSGGVLCATGATSTFPTAVQGSNGTEDSFSSANDGLVLKGHASSGDNFIMRLKPLPTVPYKQRIIFRGGNACINYDGAGICLRESSSGKIITFWTGYRSDIAKIRYDKWTGPNSFSASYLEHGVDVMTFKGGAPILILEDDSTNRNAYISYDGINKVLLYSVLRTDFCTPDQIGFFLIPYLGATTTLQEHVTVLDFSLI